MEAFNTYSDDVFSSKFVPESLKGLPLTINISKILCVYFTIEKVGKSRKRKQSYVVYKPQNTTQRSTHETVLKMRTT